MAGGGVCQAYGGGEVRAILRIGSAPRIAEGSNVYQLPGNGEQSVFKNFDALKQGLCGAKQDLQDLGPEAAR